MKEKIVYTTAVNYSAKKIKSEVSRLADRFDDICILSPALIFGHLSREEAYDNSITLLDMCDEMWILEDAKNAYGFETEYCRKHKIPVRIIGRY